MVASIRTNVGFVLAALIFGLLLLVPQAALLAQDIYKTVDEDGNTVYTDQKPSDDAEPIKLRELTVVDPVDLGETEVLDGESENGQEGPPPFRLQVAAPAPEETIWNTAYVLGVQVEASRQLPAGSELVYRIDGQERARTREQNIEIEEVWRGEHQLQVELVGSDGELIAASDPLTFYMRQASALRGPPN